MPRSRTALSRRIVPPLSPPAVAATATGCWRWNGCQASGSAETRRALGGGLRPSDAAVRAMGAAERRCGRWGTVEGTGRWLGRHITRDPQLARPWQALRVSLRKSIQKTDSIPPKSKRRRHLVDDPVAHPPALRSRRAAGRPAGAAWNILGSGLHRPEERRWPVVHRGSGTAAAGHGHRRGRRIARTPSAPHARAWSSRRAAGALAADERPAP
jgi:hypothetical protein